LRRVIALVLVAGILMAFGAFAITFHSNATLPKNAVHVSIIPGAASYATGYDPDNITVVIGVNNTVIWTNNDNEPHTVTASDKSFDSGNMNPSAPFTYTFSKPGIYAYTYHPWMRGYVAVLQTA